MVWDLGSLETTPAPSPRVAPPSCQTQPQPLTSSWISGSPISPAWSIILFLCLFSEYFPISPHCHDPTQANPFSSGQHHQPTTTAISHLFLHLPISSSILQDKSSFLKCKSDHITLTPEAFNHFPWISVGNVQVPFLLLHIVIINIIITNSTN